MKFIIFGFLMVLVAACTKNTSSKDTTGSDVSDVIEGQVGTINMATADVNTSSGTSMGMLTPYEERFINEKSLWQKIGDSVGSLFDSSLHAVTTTCANGGQVDDTGASFGTAAFTITRVWSSCARDGGAFRRNGTVYLGWSNLNASSPYVQATSVLKRATSTLTMTRTSTGNYVEISGTDSGNQVNSTNGNNVLTWNSVTGTTRSFTLTINETRIGKGSGGVTAFRHIVTTPTALTVNVDTTASTRTIASGSIKVQHALANFDVTTTFSNAVWDYSTCQPKSGSATVTVTGTVSGTGTLTFNNGSVSFTYGSNSGSITLPGC